MKLLRQPSKQTQSALKVPNWIFNREDWNFLSACTEWCNLLEMAPLNNLPNSHWLVDISLVNIISQEFPFFKS